MSYRRKAPSAAKITFAQQLGYVRNGNVGGLPFQAHDSVALLEQLKLNHPPVHTQFYKQATPQSFLSKRVIDHLGGSVTDAHAPQFVLPLPQHLIDGEGDDGLDELEPRTFYHHSVVSLPDGKIMNTNVAMPRCGNTGLFFTREEVVDNLMAASADLGFTSPFWIHTSHPQLGNFLQLRSGSEAICISLTAGVVSAEDVVDIPSTLLHPLVCPNASTPKGKKQPFSVSDDVPLGMNALTGHVTSNPFVHSLPSRGLWLSYDQVVRNNLVVKPQPRKEKPAPASKSKSKKESKSKSKNGGEEDDSDPTADSWLSVVEIEQWELHNADQLVTAGRLGLASGKSDEDRAAATVSLFT